MLRAQEREAQTLGFHLLVLIDTSETASGARIRLNPRTALEFLKKPGADFHKQGLVFVSHTLNQTTGFLVTLVQRPRTFTSPDRYRLGTKPR